MIIFEKISCKNFFSVGDRPIEIQLNKSPTTLVAGSNGSGKSSVILDSIYFALFNKPFRNVSKPNIVNSINNGHLEVILHFTIGKKKYRVVRGIKPTKFEIYENDKLLDQDAAARDYQKFLEDTILGGLNEKVFKQVVVIGSADYTPFMQLKTNDRREVIEELLDITIFSQMLNIAKEKLSALRSQLSELDYAVQISGEKIKIREEAKAKAKTETADKKKQLKESIETEKLKIVELQTTIDSLHEQQKLYEQKLIGVDLLKKSISDLQKLLNDLKNTKKTHDTRVMFFNENDDCPTCQQHIDEQHKETLQKLSTDKLTEVDGAIDRVLDQLDKKEKNLEIYQKMQTAISKIERQIFQNTSQQNVHKQLIERTKTDISALSLKSNEPNEKIAELKADHKELVSTRKEKLEEQQYYTVVSNMLRDGGIKTKIIKQYIPLMNKIINDYLVRFGLPIEFTLDENFNEVIKSRYRDGFQYNNFSEGEKQRIDTALLLAWRQIAKAKNTTNTNLLIMDETFDSSLDGGATEELLNILLEMDKHTNIFIISHKQDLSDKLRSHIEFEKQGNFTAIKTQPD